METELLPPEASTSQLALSLAPSTLSRPRRPRTVSSKSILTEGEGSEGEDEEGEEGEEGSDGEGNPHRRRKIDIRFIEDKSKRHISFSKRKAGIMKKAYELSILTGTQVLLLVVSETGLVYTFTTPQLAPLVTARDGKELIQSPSQSCLTSTSSHHANDPIPSGLVGSDFPPSESGPKRSLKKRKTVENLRAPAHSHSARSNGGLTSPLDAMNDPRLHEVIDLAQRALMRAQELPIVANLIAAYQAQDDIAHLHDVPPLPGTQPQMTPVQLTFYYFTPYLNHQSQLLSNQHGIHHDYFSGGVHALENMFDNFFQHYLPLEIYHYSPQDPNSIPAAVRSHLSVLIDFIEWCAGHRFVDHLTHSNFLARLSAALARPPSLNHQNRKGPPYPINTSSQPLTSAATSFATTPLSPTREIAALGAVKSYCQYVELRYPPRVLGDDMLEGCFVVVHLAASFILLEDPLHTSGQREQTYEKFLPVKLRLPAVASSYLRLGDQVTLGLSRMEASSIWVPTHVHTISAYPFTPLLNSDYYRQEMNRCQRDNDRSGYQVAFNTFRKMIRMETLIEEGELNDDGYGPHTPLSASPTSTSSLPTSMAGSLPSSMPSTLASMPVFSSVY